VLLMRRSEIPRARSYIRPLEDAGLDDDSGLSGHPPTQPALDHELPEPSQGTVGFLSKPLPAPEPHRPAIGPCEFILAWQARGREFISLRRMSAVLEQMIAEAEMSLTALHQNREQFLAMKQPSPCIRNMIERNEATAAEWERGWANSIVA
jgi:hypothetical protein